VSVGLEQQSVVSQRI